MERPIKLFDQTESLHGFVSRYQPSIWCEPISHCCHVPLWTKEEYEAMKNGNREGLTWYEKEAVEAFFKQLKGQKES